MRGSPKATRAAAPRRPAWAGLLLLVAACGGGSRGGEDPGGGLVVEPATVAVVSGATVRFRAHADGPAGAADVRWAVLEGDQGGTVSADGVYTAPPRTGSFHVRAASAPAGAAAVTVQVVEGADVASFGAVGDGVADDTAAFRSAAATGKPLLVRGTSAFYVLSGPVALTASVFGVGQPRIRMAGADGTTAKQMFRVVDHAGPDLRISGLHLDGQWDGQSTAGEYSALIAVYSSRDVTVEDCTLERPYGDGIYLGTSSATLGANEGVTVQANSITGPRRCAVAVIHARGVRIRGNAIGKDNDYVAAIDVEPNANDYDEVHDLEITDNTFDVKLSRAVNLYSTPATHPSGGVLVARNTARARWFFSKPNGTGDWTDVTLRDNTYLGNDGATAANTFAIVVEGAQFAPHVAANYIITGNTVTASPGATIGDYFDGVQGLVLQGNAWTATAKYAVSVRRCPGAVTSPNTITGAAFSVE